MSIKSLIFKHLWRYKRKMIGMFLCLVIVITTITALYHLIEGMNESLSVTFDEVGPNVIITPKQEDLSLTFAHITIEGETKSIAMDEIKKIDQIEYADYIAYLSPKLLEVDQINGEQVALIGVLFENEKTVKTKISYEGEYPEADHQIMVGSLLADEMNFSLGQFIDIKGEQFEITAIMKPQGNEQDQFLFIDLNKTQQLFNRENEISLIEIAAHCYSCPIYDIVSQVRVAIPSVDVKPLMDVALAREATLDRFKIFFYSVAIMLFLSGSYLLMYFMSSFTSKRRQEIGILRTIGFTNKQIEKMIFGEALILGVVGGLLGYLLGIGFVWLSKLLWFNESVILSLPLLNFLLIIGLSISMMIIAVIGPMRYASTLDPVQAIKKL
ncbi:ABC transporter permease [Anaerobacillus sp. MEB173]|uniref:ABC transporter permease n=1 Tax=Anaerobacillus sp. MEB173 TaxID=3383345 RepID=UPI003F907810